jgi:alpha-beta hydrolase superfamily lysophospholipase
MSVNIDRIKDTEAAFRIAVTRDSADTLDLRYGVHFQGKGEPERYVVFLNGRTEWLEKYAYLADDLGMPDGTAFLTWDHRGQGGSGGVRSYVDDYETYAKDTQKIVAEVTEGKPYVVLSHSMGGLIALYSTVRGYITPGALVLSSPLLGMPERPVPPKLAKPLSTALGLIGLGAVSTGGGTYTNIPFEKNKLTHHVGLYQRMCDTPYEIPGATFGWVAATFRALQVCFDPEVLKNHRVPTLVMGGSKETVVDVSAFKAWVDVASEHAPADVQLRMFPGAKHELFSEIPEYYEPAVKEAREWLVKGLSA